MGNQRATKKQQELLQFVDGFIREHGYGPSYREIMRALGYKSVSTVATHIDGLISKGYLNRRDNSARSLEVLTISSNNQSSMTKSPTVVEEIGAVFEKAESSDREILLRTLEILGHNEASQSLREKHEMETSNTND